MWDMLWMILGFLVFKLWWLWVLIGLYMLCEWKFEATRGTRR